MGQLVLLGLGRRMTKSRTRWIAERTLREGMRRERVVARLGLPRMVSDDEWVCPFEIARGTTKLVELDVSGSDSFQALRLAMEGIRRKLIELCPLASWLSGDYGDTGFEMEVPGHYGRDFARYLELLIEAETLRSGDEFRRRSTRKREALSEALTAKRRAKGPRGAKR